MKRLRLWLIRRLMPPTHYLAERTPPENFLTFALRDGYAEDVREFVVKDGVISELHGKHIVLTGFPPSP